MDDIKSLVLFCSWDTPHDIRCGQSSKVLCCYFSKRSNSNSNLKQNFTKILLTRSQNGNNFFVFIREGNAILGFKNEAGLRWLSQRRTCCSGRRTRVGPQHLREACKLHPTMASSSCLWVPSVLFPVLDSFSDRQQYGSIGQISPFPSNLLLGHGVVLSNRNPN